MKLSSEQIDEVHLSRYGSEAVELLLKHDFRSLADRFDYALKFERSPVAAIEEDFHSCLAKFRALPEQPTGIPPSTSVKYFAPNDSNLFAHVECVFTSTEGCPILVELIVTSSGADKYVTLEDISLANL